MTLIEAITAVVLLGVFLFGFSQAFLPAYNAWGLATAEYNAAHSIQFIAESFRKECMKPNPNIENWKRIIAVAKELESCETSELMRGEELWAFKAICVFAGEHLEIIGLCRP